MKTPEELAEEWSAITFDESELPEHEKSKLSDLVTYKAMASLGFLAGYQAAAPQWISVKDRLPEDGTGWLTVYGSIPNLRFFVGPGYYDYVKKEWLTRFLNYRARKDANNLVTDQIEYLPFEQVTHWMPLPKPPEE